MPKLFISYSRTDEVFARQLATSLSMMGADIWIDIRDIPAGMKWSSAIQEGLDRSDAMIIIISPASMASPNVEDEWQYYRDRGKIIVPVMIQPSQLHYQLQRLQYISFHTQPYNIALSQLHAELYRKGIILNPPPNAVTTPVPRAPAGYGAPPPSMSSSQPMPPAAARSAKRGGSNLFTLGCVGVLVVAAALGVGALLAGNFLNPGSTLSPSAQTATIIVATNNAVGTGAAATMTAGGNAHTPAPQHGVIRIVSSSARVRSGPGTNFDQINQVLAGEVYEVIAQAPSSTGTGETWFLIDLPNGSSGWVSSEPVDLQPDNVVPPTAATVPPTPTVLAPTATPPPTETATSAPNVDSATDVIQVTITASGVPYNFGFSSGRFTSLRVNATPYAGGTIRVVVRNNVGSVITDENNVGEFVIPLVPNSDYTLEVTDTSGGTGSFNMVLERSVAP
jgi:hypothetical protein